MSTEVFKSLHFWFMPILWKEVLSSRSIYSKSHCIVTFWLTLCLYFQFSLLKLFQQAAGCRKNKCLNIYNVWWFQCRCVLLIVFYNAQGIRARLTLIRYIESGKYFDGYLKFRSSGSSHSKHLRALLWLLLSILLNKDNPVFALHFILTSPIDHNRIAKTEYSVEHKWLAASSLW